MLVAVAVFKGIEVGLLAVEIWRSDGVSGGSKGCMNTPKITGIKNNERKNLTFNTDLHYLRKF